MSTTGLFDNSEERHDSECTRQIGCLDFHMLAETIPHLLWSARPDGVVDYCNSRLLNYLGKTLEEIYGWSWIELLHPDDRQRSIDTWTETFTQGKEYCIHYRIRRAQDGRHLWHEGRATPLRDAGGRVVRWFGTCTEIDERKQAELELETFEKLFRYISDMVVVAGSDGFFKRINPAFSRTLGYSEEELKSRPLIEFIHPDDRCATLDELRRQMEGNFETLSFENRYVRRDGSPRWFSWNAYYKEEEQLFFGIARDITERKQIEAALMQAKEAADAANRAKSEFLATMSHEIRTPLTVVMAALEHLGDIDPDPDRQQLLDMAGISAKRLCCLIDDILDFSRIEAREVTLEAEEFDLRRCLREVIDMFTIPAREKNLHLRMKVAPDTPERMIGDQGRLSQVLINLIGNAVKFTAEGEIRVEVEPRGDLVGFAVADTGPGIPEEKHDLLFRSFSQVDSSVTRRFGGTGLGLAISKALVELMGGEISVRSKEGSGSIFTFIIPPTPRRPE